MQEVRVFCGTLIADDTEVTTGPISQTNEKYGSKCWILDCSSEKDLWAQCWQLILAAPRGIVGLRVVASTGETTTLFCVVAAPSDTTALLASWNDSKSNTEKKNIYIYIFCIIDWIIRFINCWLFQLFSLYLSFPLTFWLSLLLRSLPLDAQQGSGMMQLLLRLGALIPTFSSFKNDSYKFPYPLPL